MIRHDSVLTHPVWLVWGLLLPGLVIVSSSSMAAQAAPPPLTRSQIRQINNDLLPSSSQDFFRQGQKQLDREVLRLYQQQDTSAQPILRINVAPPGSENGTEINPPGTAGGSGPD